MRQQTRGFATSAWGTVVLILPLLALMVSCASKSKGTQLQLESTTFVLPPELREVTVTRDGRPVGPGDQVKEGDRLLVELTGTEGVAGVVEHGGRTERLSDSGGGRYAAQIQIPRGAPSPYRLTAWLTDPAATPPDSSQRAVALQVAPPPPPRPIDPLAERRKQARAALHRTPRVRFARGSDKMIGDSGASLDNWAKVIQDYPDLEFVIFGACSAEGQEYYNSVLGLRRTVVVRTGLIERGADNSRIGVNSLGASRASNCAEKPAQEREECRASDRWADVEPAGYDPEIDSP